MKNRFKEILKVVPGVRILLKKRNVHKALLVMLVIMKVLFSKILLVIQKRQTLYIIEES